MTAPDTIDHPSILLSATEIKQVSGGYTQPCKQLEELHKQGFWRARRAPMTGAVILERDHYAAVCAGQTSESPGRFKAGKTPELMPA